MLLSNLGLLPCQLVFHCLFVLKQLLLHSLLLSSHLSLHLILSLLENLVNLGLELFFLGSHSVPFSFFLFKNLQLLFLQFIRSLRFFPVSLILDFLLESIFFLLDLLLSCLEFLVRFHFLFSFLLLKDQFLFLIVIQCGACVQSSDGLHLLMGSAQDGEGLLLVRHIAPNGLLG